MSMIEENEKHKISCYKIKKPSHSDYIYLEEQKNNTISGNIIVIAILFIVFVLLPLTSFKREEGDIMYLLPLLGIFGWIVYQLSMDTVLTTKNKPQFFQLEIDGSFLVESWSLFDKCYQRKTHFSEIAEITQFQHTVSGKKGYISFNIQMRNRSNKLLFNKSFDTLFQKTDIDKIKKFSNKANQKINKYSSEHKNYQTFSVNYK